MYNIIKNEIKNGTAYTKVCRMIDIAKGAQRINDEQYAQLHREALAAADGNDNQPELREMVLALEERVKALEEKAGVTHEPEQDETNQTEYETWKPWDGLSNKYQYGAIVYHPGTGKLWESTFSGQNTWEPGAIGTEALWREVAV